MIGDEFEDAVAGRKLETLGEDPGDKTLCGTVGKSSALLNVVFEFDVDDVGVDGGGDGVVRLPPPPLAITGVAGVAVAVGVGKSGRVIDR
jgi:hypothetical protein